MATVTGWSSSFGRQTAACQKLLVEDHSMAGREGAGGLALMSLSSQLLVPHESLLLAEHNEIHRESRRPPGSCPFKPESQHHNRVQMGGAGSAGANRTPSLPLCSTL